jgi:hypothetical protein
LKCILFDEGEETRLAFKAELVFGIGMRFVNFTIHRTGNVEPLTTGLMGEVFYKLCPSPYSQ